VHAEDLLFSGRAIDGAEAARIGLANAAVADPEAAALDYFDRHLAPHSASSLRFAVSAAHGAAATRIKDRLAEVETLYLDGLMATHDATEGLRAFIEKRPTNWENR
jgi:cyclohexa-1,5-dienecarbonyl-CoA hydratase